MRATPKLCALSKDTLRHLACGLTVEDIAATTWYSYDGIKSRVSKLYREIGAVNAPNAVALGHAYGFLEPITAIDVDPIAPDDVLLIWHYALGEQRHIIAAALGTTVPALEYRKKIIRQVWGTPTPAAMVDTAHHAGLVAHIPRKDYRK